MWSNIWSSEQIVSAMKIVCGWTYSVYKLTLPDGKVYIGQTAQDVNDRWCGGFGYRDNSDLFRAVFWYGWMNVKKEVLATKLSKYRSLEMEHNMILRHNSVSEGYNGNSGYLMDGLPPSLFYTISSSDALSGMYEGCFREQPKDGDIVTFDKRLFYTVEVLETDVYRLTYFPKYKVKDSPFIEGYITTTIKRKKRRGEHGEEGGAE